ncbi:MAG: aminotransferase class IV, partial [Acidimicrobiia bacterium]
IFTVSGGVVYTPPVSSGILEGITRNTVLELLEAEGVEVRETEMARGSLYTAEEVFLTGTAAEVTPIREIDGRIVGPGHPGPVTRKAQDLFAAVVNGKLDEYKHWLSYV